MLLTEHPPPFSREANQLLCPAGHLLYKRRQFRKVSSIRGDGTQCRRSQRSLGRTMFAPTVIPKQFYPTTKNNRPANRTAAVILLFAVRSICLAPQHHVLCRLAAADALVGNVLLVQRNAAGANAGDFLHLVSHASSPHHIASIKPSPFSSSAWVISSMVWQT